MPARRRLLAVLMVAACGKGDSGRSIPETVRIADSAASKTVAVACPADGRWHECSVLERLDRAGLAPRRDSTAVSEKLLSRSGVLVHLGNAELELFVYPDEAARAADEKKLDSTQFIDPSAQPTIRRERTLIRSVNLLGLLKSINSHQRERVSDALTAGPPQPQK